MPTSRLTILMPVLFVLGCAVASPTIAQGGPPPPPTNILFGFVSNSRTLTYTTPGPVYYVVGDVVVLAGATLTIDPGVTIVFEANRDTLQGGNYPSLSELNIQGSLMADASAGDSIKFVSSAGGNSEWGGIRIESGVQCTMSRCSIRGAYVAVNSTGSLTISNLSAYGTDYGISSNGHLVLTSAVLDGFNSAVSAYGDGSIQQVSISGAGTGIDATGFAGSIRECTIRGRGTHLGSGLALGPNCSTAPNDSTDVRISTSSGFATGVFLSNSAVARNLLSFKNDLGFNADYNGNQIIYCTAASNGVDGMRLNVNSRVYCSISAMNGSFGVTTAFGCQAYTNYVDAWLNGSGNFGGCFAQGTRTASFNPFFVSAGTDDYHLASGSLFKTYGPWGAEIGAYGPGPGSPTPATVTSWGRVKANYR